MNEGSTSLGLLLNKHQHLSHPYEPPDMAKQRLHRPLREVFGHQERQDSAAPGVALAPVRR